LKKFQNPETAYAAFAAEPQKPSLLLTDYAMGSMTGIELSAKCKEDCPELKILMVSGTAGPEIVLDAPVKVDHFMAKPYRPTELAETVRTLLAD
jgi:CheY-like chemotaxis protein